MKNIKNLTIGIDAGKHTGLAVFKDRKLYELKSLNTYQAIVYLQDNKDLIEYVIIEDSSKQSYIWNKNGKNNSSLGKHARDIGSIDGKVKVFIEACKEMNIEIIPISPLKKGKKWSHEEFKSYFPTYKGTTNPHKRDALKCVLCLGLGKFELYC